MRQHGAQDVGRAEDVGGELRLDLLAAALLDGAGEDVAGVVDEDVDAGGLREDGGDGGGERRVTGGDVEVVGEGAARLQVGEVGGVAVGGDDGVAVLQGGQGQFAAEAGGAAGDEPDFGGAFLLLSKM